MAKIEMKGLNEYAKALSRLEASVREEICGKAIYDAADIIADQIREGIDTVPTDSGMLDEFWGGLMRGPNKRQIYFLKKSLGIARMRTWDDLLNVKVGWDGYNDIKTKRWPNGQPNAMIARSIERGTSFMEATPFIKRAVSRGRKSALEAMRETVEKGVKDAMEK